MLFWISLNILTPCVPTVPHTWSDFMNTDDSTCVNVWMTSKFESLKLLYPKGSACWPITGGLEKWWQVLFYFQSPWPIHCAWGCPSLGLPFIAGWSSCASPRLAGSWNRLLCSPHMYVSCQGLGSISSPTGHVHCKLDLYLIRIFIPWLQECCCLWFWCLRLFTFISSPLGNFWFVIWGQRFDTMDSFVNPFKYHKWIKSGRVCLSPWTYFI